MGIMWAGAGMRSNFIAGSRGGTRAAVDELEHFLAAAGLDAIGVFGYSDEDGTEAATLPGQLAAEEIASRVEQLAGLADELMDQRAADRVGETNDVLIEELIADDGDGSALRYGGGGAPPGTGGAGAAPGGAAPPPAMRDATRGGGSGRPAVGLGVGPI